MIAAHHAWYQPLGPELERITGCQFISVTQRENLTTALLDEIRPRYVFLPHWSFMVPKEIFQQYECVIFHMTDLPFGRGGSPLQNLISRGIYETKICALQCEADLDAGPVYLRRPLSLLGSAEEIYLRAANLIQEMILEIVKDEPTPIPQDGEATYFKRRTPEQSNVSETLELVEIFDAIRMLDAEDYPSAFLETKHLRFEFQRASLKSDAVLADVRITRKKTDET